MIGEHRVCQVQLKQSSRDESAQSWKLWQRTHRGKLQGKVLSHLHNCNIYKTYRSFQCMPPMPSFCEGILGFTGVWGRDHTITTLDAHPMAPRMDVATIGRSLSTWRFSLSLLSEVPTQFHLCHKRSSSTQRSAATQAVSTEETITIHGTITGLADTGASLS